MVRARAATPSIRSRLRRTQTYDLRSSQRSGTPTLYTYFLHRHGVQYIMSEGYVPLTMLPRQLARITLTGLGLSPPQSHCRTRTIYASRLSFLPSVASPLSPIMSLNVAG